MAGKAPHEIDKDGHLNFCGTNQIQSLRIAGTAEHEHLFVGKATKFTRLANACVRQRSGGKRLPDLPKTDRAISTCPYRAPNDSQSQVRASPEVLGHRTWLQGDQNLVCSSCSRAHSNKARQLKIIQYSLGIRHVKHGGHPKGHLPFYARVSSQLTDRTAEKQRVFQ